MDNANRYNTVKDEPRYTLGMSSFGMSSFNQSDRQTMQEQFGQNVRLAMGCIEASAEPVKGKAIPSDEASIRARLKALSQEITSQQADLLELLVKFDDLEGWKASGASHCAAWMNYEIGISMKLSWEYLRVGRKLALLPILKALFRAGKLSWSKVRLISRVADQENEPLLCHAALDASVSQVKRLCDEYRWGEDGNSENDIKYENEKALKQWESRSLTWNETSNGSTQIQLVLPPEIAQAFLNSVEHSLNQLDSTDSSMALRRADAAVLMAETSLQSAGKAIATADRYQVIVSVDASELPKVYTNHWSDNTSSCTATNENNETIIPPKRATINGASPIARETARRISCDCSLSIIKKVNGEPVDIGRKSRIWPNAMERAIKERDKHCVWPGCTQSRHLHIHHIKHWADGGTTSVENGACVCSHHHALVHEGGYTIQHVDDVAERMHEQFTRQQHSDDIGLFDFERALRNSRESFDTVRSLLPEQYRFRIIDEQGNDVLDMSNAGINHGIKWPSYQPHHSTHSTYSTQATQATNATNAIQKNKSTRVDCSEAIPEYFCKENINANQQLFDQIDSEPVLRQFNDVQSESFI